MEYVNCSSSLSIFAIFVNSQFGRFLELLTYYCILGFYYVRGLNSFMKYIYQSFVAEINQGNVVLKGRHGKTAMYFLNVKLANFF